MLRAETSTPETGELSSVGLDRREMRAYGISTYST